MAEAMPLLNLQTLPISGDFHLFVKGSDIKDPKSNASRRPKPDTILER